MKKILAGILSLVIAGAFSITAFAADNIALKINGTLYNGTTFQKCIEGSGIPTNSITSLEIVSGTIKVEDWYYIAAQSGGRGTPNMSQSLESLVIRNEVVLSSLEGNAENEISNGAFKLDNELRTVDTGSAQVIKELAFFGCESLSQVTAPNVTIIESRTFDDCISLETLNLPAIPPTAYDFYNTPSIKHLGFVSTTGVPLTGADLKNAISAYKAVDDGDTTDDLWYGWKIPKAIIAPDTNSDSTIHMNGTTIPAPTYTVKIPEKLEFNSITKKLKSTSDENAMAKTSMNAVIVNYSHFFDNQKNITVTVSTDNKIVKDKNSLIFKLYEKGAEKDREIVTGSNLFTIQPIEEDTNAMVEKQIYAELDQRLIKVSGDYTGTVTFTVFIADNE